MDTFKFFLKLKSYFFFTFSLDFLKNYFSFSFFFNIKKERKIIVQRSPFIYKKAREQFSVKTFSKYYILRIKNSKNIFFISYIESLFLLLSKNNKFSISYISSVLSKRF